MRFEELSNYCGNSSLYNYMARFIGQAKPLLADERFLRF